MTTSENISTGNKILKLMKLKDFFFLRGIPYPRQLCIRQSNHPKQKPYIILLQTVKVCKQLQFCLKQPEINQDSLIKIAADKVI